MTLVGRELGPYHVDARLGAGAMGEVYRAQVVRRTPGLPTGVFVALKVIRPHLLSHEGFFRRFLREAALGKAVRHPNVVRVHDVDAVLVDGAQVTFLVMEYVAGQTLRDLRRSGGPLPSDLCLHLAREAARGLAAIHGAGALHRDLKPENVILTGDQYVKLMDLGLSVLHDESVRLSRTGHFIGTYRYAAPEQIRQPEPEFTERTDLFALGLLLHELAAGRPPRKSASAEDLLAEIRRDDPEPLSDVVPGVNPFLAAVVTRLLERDPERRFPTAARLVEVLDAGENGTWWRRRARTTTVTGPQPSARSRVVGREAEFTRLAEVWAAARAGEGAAVLLEGEAGAGKTCLVDAFVDDLSRGRERADVLSGIAPAGGVEAGPGAFLSALRRFLGSAHLEERLIDLLPASPRAREALASLLRGEPVEPWLADDMRDATWNAFRDLVLAFTKRRPVVFVVEDLHHAPERTWTLFDVLARAAPTSRLLLVGTMRPEGTAGRRAALERLPALLPLRIERLSTADCARLVASELGEERVDADEVARAIAERTDGNPYFALELARELARAGPAAGLADLTVPASVRDLLAGRLAHRTPEEIDLLRVAACQGAAFDPVAVARVLERPAVGVLRDLGRLCRPAGLVRPEGRRYRFTPAQLADVVLDQVPPLLRECYHAGLGDAIAAALPDPPGPSAEVVEACDQWLRGGAVERALELLPTALDHLERRFHDRTAARLIARTPRGALSDEQFIELGLRAAKALGRSGARDAARSRWAVCRDLAERLGDPDLLERVRAADPDSGAASPDSGGTMGP